MTLPDDRHEWWRNATVWSVSVFAATLPFSHVPAQLALASAMVFWIGWSVTARKAMIRNDVFFLAAGAYWVWNLIAALLSARPQHTLWAFFDNEWPAVAGILMFWSVRDSAELRRVLMGFFVSSGIAMLYGIIQTFTGVEWIGGATLHSTTEGLYRAVGFSGFYLTFAGFAMAVLFLSIAYALEKPNQKVRWVVPILSILAILGTFARSVWLALSVLLPIFAFLALPKRQQKWFFAAGSLIVIVVFASEPLRERALSIFDLAQHETRLNLWKTSLRMAVDNPFFGIGQDNFTLAFDSYRVEGFYDTFVHPHNDYLSVLVHGGIPALAAFIAMWTIMLRRGWRTWRAGNSDVSAWMGLGGMVALAGFLGSSLFQNYYGTFVNCFNWWFVTGVILSSYRIASQHHSSSM